MEVDFELPTQIESKFDSNYFMHPGLAVDGIVISFHCAPVRTVVVKPKQWRTACDSMRPGGRKIIIKQHLDRMNLWKVLWNSASACAKAVSCLYTHNARALRVKLVLSLLPLSPSWPARLTGSWQRLRPNLQRWEGDSSQQSVSSKERKNISLEKRPLNLNPLRHLRKWESKFSWQSKSSI